MQKDPTPRPSAVQEHAMKAIVRDRYGSPDVLELREIDKPVVEDGEVLVRVHAAGVNMADVDYLRGQPYIARLGTGLPRPKNPVLGLDVAGTVEAVGTSVTRFQPGDQVFGDLTEHGYGAFAEYACAPEDAFARSPAGMTFEEAAAVPQSGIMALQGLVDKRRIRPGHEVLINGAGGGVGPFAVQIAKSFGAEVTGVDGTEKLDLVRSIGADHVIDYTREDYTQLGRRYDRILDVAGNRSIFDCRRALKPKGRYVVIPGSISRLFQAMVLGPLISTVGSRKMGMLMWKPFKREDVTLLTELIEAGQVASVIDRRFPLSGVAEALRYQEEGRARGKLVITV
jgi:NADPH:quinone reductase-like Zn-dependent oxidoreductase